jgi:multiple sugar transport system permease protein
METKQTTVELEAALSPEEKKALHQIEKGEAIDDARFQPTYQKAKDDKVARTIFKVLTYVFLAFFAFIILAPFIFMISTSLTDPTSYNKAATEGTVSLITTSPSTVNFGVILGGINPGSAAFNSLPAELRSTITRGAVNFTPYFLNTIIVAVISTAFTVFTTVMTSFAFARLDFKGKNTLFAILLATMMVPGEMMIITNYQTTIGLGWENSFMALIFVHGVSVFYIFQLRQTFQQIPNELFLASKVDGYGEFHYLWRVMIPLGMPTIVTITILNVMGSWNAYIWPQLIANGDNLTLYNWGIEWTMKLVSNGLMSLFTSDYGSFDTVKIAGSMIISAPLLVVFIFFRKYIMRGVSRSGIKG